MMDKMGRILMHTIIQTTGMDLHNKQSIVKWKTSRWDDISGKIFYNYPRVKSPDGKTIRLTRVRINKPQSEELLKNYEDKKHDFTQKLMESAELKIQESEQAKLPKARKTYKRDLIVAELESGALNHYEIAKKHKASLIYVRTIDKELKA